MAWVVKYAGKTLDSDDFTIAELGEVEKATGTPWSISNPLRDVKVARAFIAVLMLRTMTEEETASALKSMTLRKLRVAFEYRDDDEVEDSEDAARPLESPGGISPESLPGELNGDGLPASPDKSA